MRLSDRPHIVSAGIAGFQTTLGFKNLCDKRNPVSGTQVDMARHGHDVTPWLGELNAEMLASFVGFFLTRSLKPPLKPGDNLRQMQALSAAVAYDLLQSI